MVKLPEPPTPAALRRVKPETRVLPAGTGLWRIYFRGGRHPTRWDRMREFGPLPNARFDHHDEPRRVQEERQILYATTGEEAIVTCLAEVFQENRLMDPYQNAPWLANFVLTDDVLLLDLTGPWPTRAGASMEINFGPRPRTRRWSKAIHQAYPDLCGLFYASSMHAGKPTVALYERARYAIPTIPTFNEPLSHPGLRPVMAHAAALLGYKRIP